MHKIIAFIIFAVSIVSGIAGTVTLGWDAVPNTVDDFPVAGYRVYYGIASGVYTNSVDAGNTTQVTVIHLVNGVTYFFAVTAYDMVGLESDFSDEVSTTIPALPAPTMVQVAILQNRLSWIYPNPVPDMLTGFLVTRREPGIVQGEQWAVLDPQTSSCPLPPMVSGMIYEFSVVAFEDIDVETSKAYQVSSPASDVFSYLEPLVAYAGTGPKILPLQIRTDGGARLTFFGPAGQRNVVWGSVKLGESANWQSLGTATELITGQYQFTDVEVFPARYYRILDN